MNTVSSPRTKKTKKENKREERNPARDQAARTGAASSRHPLAPSMDKAKQLPTLWHIFPQHINQTRAKTRPPATPPRKRSTH